ncbi:hypothetical protein PRIC1_005448 [Phytophthora ramorum]|uniref:PX domain-containing protein n=1 Tax=Phytophthora ramorum TaxID=164328 RepID=H3GVY7_PHYRM|nr:hypothetical protein KRP23_9068 [Phytophthora ramorum]KAH7472110.1 hypothetical protein KRP23_9105 [Phytophthora ramorum]KAH7506772.1 hypothetical protein KRP22_4725 [Phytophthora ramorum]
MLAQHQREARQTSRSQLAEWEFDALSAWIRRGVGACDKPGRTSASDQLGHSRICSIKLTPPPPMPYESFKSSQHVSIRGLVQDRKTGTWRYLLQVTRHMKDDAFGESVPRRQKTDPAAFTRPCTTQSYAIRRSFEDFKRLHEAVAPLMARGGKSQLPKLPNDSLLTFFVGETQTALQKKRLALERVLAAIEAHPAASDAPEYGEFLANLNSYEEVTKAPLSPSISSRSSFSFSEDGTVTPREFVGPNVLTTSRSANALRRAYYQHDTAARENHVAFSHFSMT